jgi:hypothetical protein
MSSQPPKNQPKFPEPVVISGRMFWRRGVVRKWLAEVAGEPAPEPRDDDESLLTARTVRQQYLGGISEMSLWRWRRPTSPSKAA